MGDEILSAARVREVLDYDPATGVFRWKVKSAIRIKVGDLAGAINKHGYRYIKVDTKCLKANRLAWLYVTGEWPCHFVDHINGIKSDDKFSNLRDVRHAENIQNERKARANSKSGVLGVTRHHRSGGQWRADIGVSGKNVYLGPFKTIEEASQAYLEAKRMYHPGCMI